MRLTRSGRVLSALIFVWISAFLLTSRDVWAQSFSAGAIAGAVKDASGGAMAGVTVVAASPALIEKERTVVTDDHGEYKIEDLRPGTYSVTFSLSGFATIKREGLELNTGITLPVDVEMQVASTAETVTVTTGTPVVDVENTNPENVLVTNQIATLPTAMAIPAYTELTLGATQTGAPDVGGNQGEENTAPLIHDSRTNEDDALYDGMSYGNGDTTGGEGQRAWLVNKISVQEVTVSTTAGGAEAGHPGANINFVPKTGGDQFHGAIAFTGANRDFQMSNLNAALQARGLLAASPMNYTYDLGAGVGGPIKRGKLWFWVAFGDWANQNYVAGNYFNATQHTSIYTPDLTKQAHTWSWNKALDVRLDWQASKKNKFSSFEGFLHRCVCYQGVDNGTTSPEATDNLFLPTTLLNQASWSRMQTDRLLFRVAFTSAIEPGTDLIFAPDSTENSTDIPVTLQNTGYKYGAYLGLSTVSYGHPVLDQYNGVATVAYVTGSHALKAGFTWQWDNGRHNAVLNSLPGYGPISYTLNQAAGATVPTPVSLTEWVSPQNYISRSWVNALYVQDQWTLRRLTLNLGLRYDWERGYSPAQTQPATAFTSAFVFAAVNNIPNWKDISPRVGAAYDIFGNGKSAIKGAIGRYVIGDYSSTTEALSPANSIVTSATRSWKLTPAEIAAAGPTPLYIPNCNLQLTTANGDCGALSNAAFGTLSTSTTYDPSVVHGWDVRPYNWQADIQFQQELKPGMGVTVGYYRTWYENFTVTENTAVSPTNYGTFCITGPTDSRVPALTGQTVCGFHDVNPTTPGNPGFGNVQNFVTKASNFGGQSEVYNGFDVNLHARFGRGGFVNGGFATGKVSYNDCAIAINYPNVTVTQTNAVASVSGNPTTPTQFCHYVIPWVQGSQVKAQVSYPLPWWSLETSVVYQNLAGFPYNTSYVASDAQIKASLGRDLSSGASTETLTNALFAPFSQHEARLNQVDWRVTRLFKIKERLQIDAHFDIYNITNSNTIINENTTYSATTTYLRPSAILGPRLFKLGTNITF